MAKPECLMTVFRLRNESQVDPQDVLTMKVHSLFAEVSCSQTRCGYEFEICHLILTL